MKNVYVNWVCMAAVFGFLASLSVPPFMLGSFAALLLAFCGYFLLKRNKSRKIFTSLCAVSIAVGAVVGRVFFQDGEISGSGLFVLSVVMLLIFYFLYQIILLERNDPQAKS